MPFVGLGIGVGKGGGAAVPTVPTFQFTVDTTQSGVSASDQFTLPLTTSSGLDCVVDWGDGTSDNITSHTAPEVTHTYPSGGTYTIAISGDLLGWQFNNGGDKLKMLDIQKWGALNISVILGFYGCINLTASATDAPTITSTNLYFCFANCPNFNGAIGNWDVSNVTNMAFMLYNADAFDQDISSWDINQVTNFSNFMLAATGLSTTNYDALLVGWEAQAPTSGININFGGSKYTAGSAAATARQSLIDNYSWTITDGGTA